MHRLPDRRTKIRPSYDQLTDVWKTIFLTRTHYAIDGFGVLEVKNGRWTFAAAEAASEQMRGDEPPEHPHPIAHHVLESLARSNTAMTAVGTFSRSIMTRAIWFRGNPAGELPSWMKPDPRDLLRAHQPDLRTFTEQGKIDMDWSIAEPMLEAVAARLHKAFPRRKRRALGGLNALVSRPKDPREWQILACLTTFVEGLDGGFGNSSFWVDGLLVATILAEGAGDAEGDRATNALAVSTSESYQRLRADFEAALREM